MNRIANEDATWIDLVDVVAAVGPIATVVVVGFRDDAVDDFQQQCAERRRQRDGTEGEVRLRCLSKNEVERCDKDTERKGDEKAEVSLEDAPKRAPHKELAGERCHENECAGDENDGCHSAWY